jgi:hypothetical protein
MAKVDEYRAYVQELIRRYVNQRPSSEGIETQTIFDTERDHYLLANVGWYNNRRVYGCVLHIDIKDSKVWIQYNGTEHAVADELVALGVPKEDIVLGFHSPYKRQFTGFAVS